MWLILAYLLGFVSGYYFLVFGAKVLIRRGALVPAERLIDMTVERDSLQSQNDELRAEGDYFRERIRELQGKPDGGYRPS